MRGFRNLARGWRERHAPGHLTRGSRCEAARVRAIGSALGRSLLCCGKAERGDPIKVERGDPITLTLAAFASRPLPLSRARLALPRRACETFGFFGQFDHIQWLPTLLGHHIW
jgi:hypothetical protein